jgi:2-polyprenyl-3-methyl-5-hydroxy-6-metoxy-1,4-benzoquinol methylase
MISPKTQTFIDQRGEWTAMAIKLSDGSYTREPRPDHRLRRLLQVASDVIKKPLSECRVLDLACLEGHYAIEFALQGAEAVGIEGRAVSVEKCDFVKNDLGLTKASFFEDDVLNLSAEKYGTFDIVVCSGILYHLRAADALRFLKSIHEVCKGVVLIDTFVSLSGRDQVEAAGLDLRGHSYFEHQSTDSDADRSAKLWASLRNETSFWLTEPSLVNALTTIGFSSVMDVLTPTMQGNPRDRKTYLAIKGNAVSIKSSDTTRDTVAASIPEGTNPLVDASQTPRSKVFQLAKASLPPSVKNMIKPALRVLRVLPKDPTPEFMRRKRSA